MQIYGVVAEYNPLHNGHKYHLSQIRKNNDNGIVVVMSGNYVERSETAVISKRYRTQMALNNGADLVIELPLCYATASAEKFAFGAVYLLDSIGVTDKLSFGSECGDVSLLKDVANAVLSDEVNKEIKAELEKGISYPTARMNAVKNLFSEEYADIISKPNNILGIEYIKALIRLNSNIEPETVARKGCGHDSKEINGDILSASAIRELVLNRQPIEKFLPENVMRIINSAKNSSQFPADFKKLETAIIASLRQKTSKDFENIPDVSEGIENRIIASAKTATNLEELYMNAKTKRYTHSRIRRIILYSFLGITKNYYNELPQYIKVLGFNSTGKKILRKAKDCSKLPIVMSASDIKKLSVETQSLYELECRSTDLFNMTLPKIFPCGTEMTDNIVIFE